VEDERTRRLVEEWPRAVRAPALPEPTGRSLGLGFDRAPENACPAGIVSGQRHAGDRGEWRERPQSALVGPDEPQCFPTVLFGLVEVVSLDLE